MPASPSRASVAGALPKSNSQDSNSPKSKRPRLPPGVPPLLNSIEVTAARLGQSRSQIYNLLGEGALSAVKIHTRTMVPEDSLRAYVDRLVEEGRTSFTPPRRARAA